MGILFPNKRETASCWAAVEPKGRHLFLRQCLYRRVRLCVILGVGIFGATLSFAQGDKPQLKRPSEDRPDRPEEKKKVKKGKDPRAVGVLEFRNGKGTLVPVAILVDGRFYDASAYKADPIPMALESGTVYEAEQAGEGQGLFTVSGALRSKNPGSAHPWVGSGTFLVQGTEAPKSSRKAEDVPVGIEGSGDEPPRLTRKKSAETNADPVAAPNGKSGDQKAGEKDAGASDKNADSAAKQAATPKTPTNDEKTGLPSQSGSAAPSKSSEGKVADSGSAKESTASAKSGEESDNYYRPTLRRGKPTQVAPEDKESVTPKTGSGKDDAGLSNSDAIGNVRTVAAISDAGGPGPQSYKFFWKTGEEEERRGQMLALAQNEVRAYATALVKNQIPAKPQKSKAGAAKGKQVEPILENVEFRGFDVWVTNQPLMILSAEARFPVTPGAAAPAAEPYSITLVARTDIYGSLRRVFSGVTDRFHLDVTPRLELIDAVDTDGDGRAELLFRETSDAGSGYVIYRATADRLWKMFDSLNAE
jgi:hypothetical protein